MTKDEAIEALAEGDKVTHERFTDKEYVWLIAGQLTDEFGNRLSDGDFWDYRRDKAYDIGWSIFNS